MTTGEHKQAIYNAVRAAARAGLARADIMHVVGQSLLDAPRPAPSRTGHTTEDS